MHDGRGRLPHRETRERDLAPASARPPRTLFAVGPAATFGVALLVTVISAWATMATWYILSREDLVAELLRRHAQAEARYEDHLGALRARLDRVASQKLIDQDTMEQRVAALVSRQAEVETRQAVLADLAQRIAPVAVTGSLPQDARPSATTPSVPAAASGFAPVGGPAGAAGGPHPRGQAAPGAEPVPAASARRCGSARREQQTGRLDGDAPVTTRLVAAERSLWRVEEGQILALEQIRAQVDAEAGVMREAIETAGLDPRAARARLPRTCSRRRAIGGPFIPIGIDAEAGGFEARRRRPCRRASSPATGCGAPPSPSPSSARSTATSP